MTIRKPLGRRAILRGAVGSLPVAIALPALDAMMNGNGNAFADGTPRPKRFGVWYFSGGTVNSAFYPRNVGPNWTPSPMLKPLEPVKDYVTVVSGTNFKLTGVAHDIHALLPLTNSYYKDPNSPYGFGRSLHPSLDQIIAAAWKGQTRLRSLEVGIVPKAEQTAAFGPGGAAVPNEYNLGRVFDRLFTNGLPAAATPTARSHRSVLDATMTDAQELAAKVGTADRRRIDAHLEAIRAVERQIEQGNPGAPAGGTCVKPTRPAYGYDKNHPDRDGLNRTLSDLLALAFACDLTRVFSLQYSNAMSSATWWEVGSTDAEHGLTHGNTVGNTVNLGADNAVWTEWGTKITTFKMKQLYYLIDKLKSTREGDGNLLDSSLVYVTTEFLQGPSHSYDNHPILLAGKGGGTIKAGHHLSFPGETMGKVGLTCLKAMGLDVPGFGGPDLPCYAKTPLSGILA